jgi:class 3 adenylate cyclase/tetratricopeptide (TPR) repeat protein
MTKTIEEQIIELQQAINAQEALRESLGEDVVDATIAAIREKLAKLSSATSKERKLVTCLFCDVVGSTRLAAERDPEEVLRIIDGALMEMRAAVERFGGNVSRYMGDGVLAFFGAPRALEGHAEQAIRAGLEIQSRMDKYAAQLNEEYRISEFKVRIGINSGYVVAGNVDGAAGEYTVIGDTVNIASRLEEAAPPGGVVVGENTFRLAGGGDHFDVESWGKIEIKGEPEPVGVYQILKLRTQGKARKTVFARGPLAGREPELKLLKERFEALISNRRTQVVLIEGEAGIGKSRLRQEFVAWLAQVYPDAQVWLGRGFSYTHQTPYALAGSLIRSALGIFEADNADLRREKLEEASRQISKEQIHGLAAILALKYPDDSISELEPQARRHAIFAAFKSFCVNHADGAPLVLVFEDIHWADDISLDLLEFLVEEAQHELIYCLMLTRPVAEVRGKHLDLERQMSADSYCAIQLGYLTPHQTGSMIFSLLSSTNVSDDIIQPIQSVTRGNPFFIEELISSFKEDGTLEAINGGWRMARSLEEIQVPETVQGVLADRIDRLEPDLKRVIQHAAIIGRTFWQELLNNLVNQNIEPHLSSLADQEFVERHGRAVLVQDWEWIFRHVLMQEVAYASVLKEVRRDVHRKIAQLLEQHGADRLDELTPALAFHFEQGQVWSKAIVYLAQAADRSKGIYALREAAGFLNRAVRLAENNPEAVDQQTLLNLLENRGEVRGLEGEFAGAAEDLNRVLESARREADKPRERDLLISLGLIYRRADDYENAMEYLGQGLDTVREMGDRRGAADVLYHLGSVVWSQGDNVRSTAFHEEALQISRDLGLRDLVAVQALHGRAEAYWFSAKPQKAVDLFIESLELARQIGDKSYEAENLQTIAMMHDGMYGMAEYEHVRKYANESLVISQEAHLHWHAVTALLTLGSNFIGMEDFQQGIDYLVLAIDQAKNIGALRLVSIGLDMLGNYYQALNLFNHAEMVHSEALEIERKIGSNFFLPRIQADLAIDRLRLGDLGIGPDLVEALEEAQTRDQLSHAVRCLEGLAELSHFQGDHEAAYRWATELLQIAQPGELRGVVTNAYVWQGKSKLAAGSPEAAEGVLRKAKNLAEMIGAPRLRWDVHEALAEVYHVQGNQKQAAQHKEIVRTIIQRLAANLKEPELRKGLPES